jgi:hypothetical protein
MVGKELENKQKKVAGAVYLDPQISQAGFTGQKVPDNTGAARQGKKIAAALLSEPESSFSLHGNKTRDSFYPCNLKPKTFRPLLYAPRSPLLACSPMRYLWIASAAFRPAPMARMTVADPVTMSPPA